MPSEMMDDGNDAVSSDPPTEETTAPKRQRLNSAIGTLTFADSVHATQLPSLPFEIVVEILSRLPVKLLLQLQSVCKSWKSLISDPKFINKHLTTRHPLLLNFCNRPGELVLTIYPLSSIFSKVTATAAQLEFPLNSRSGSVQLVDSCHGILCFEIDQCLLLLWNPSIRKFTKLPFLDNSKPQRRGYTKYGFGCTHFSNNYKVVAISSYYDGGYKTHVNILTLGTSAWRRIQDFPWYPLGGSGKFLSGTVNWLAMASIRSCYSFLILSFDLEKESYQNLSPPDYGDVTVDALSLAVLRDCLCILSHTNTFSDVWLMTEYGNKDSWTKLFSIPHTGDVVSLLYTKPLYVSEDDKVLLEYRSGLIVYNARDGTFKTPEFQNSGRSMVPKIHQESLISPCF